jgi:hypothetical protein
MISGKKKEKFCRIADRSRKAPSPCRVPAIFPAARRENYRRLTAFWLWIVRRKITSQRQTKPSIQRLLTGDIGRRQVDAHWLPRPREACKFSAGR